MTHIYQDANVELIHFPATMKEKITYYCTALRGTRGSTSRWIGDKFFFRWPCDKQVHEILKVVVNHTSKICYLVWQYTMSKSA